MEELFTKQPFYNNLTEDTKKLVLQFFKSYQKKKMINNISIYLYLLIGIIFLIAFKEIMFQKIYISNINTVFQLCKYLAIIGGLLAASNLITKKSSKEYDKSFNKIKSYLLLDICNCENKCHCKKEIVKFLSSLGFYLI